MSQVVASNETRNTIALGDAIYPAARCPICPGNTMIFPPEALEEHMARHTPTGRLFRRTCKSCAKQFFIDRPIRTGLVANYCPPCRTPLVVGTVVKTKSTKRMSSSGVEKKETIRAL
jgi:hypothetical protein